MEALTATVEYKEMLEAVKEATRVSENACEVWWILKNNNAPADEIISAGNELDEYLLILEEATDNLLEAKYEAKCEDEYEEMMKAEAEEAKENMLEELKFTPLFVNTLFTQHGEQAFEILGY